MLKKINNMHALEHALINRPTARTSSGTIYTRMVARLCVFLQILQRKNHSQDEIFHEIRPFGFDIRKWALRCVFLGNRRPHQLHIKLRSSVCVLVCMRNSLTRKNSLGQNSHLCGRTLAWVFICCCNIFDDVKRRLHSMHSNCFNPVWMAVWLFNAFSR